MMTEKLILKICCGDWENASHDKRELSVCRELGLRILVMAKGKPKDKYRKDSESGFDILRFSTRPLGTYFPVKANRLVSIFTWAHYARKLNPDIISGHDMGALFIGWLSNLFRGHKAVLIYDSHEFEIGRSVKRNKLQLWRVTNMERFLIKRCAFSIMVNDPIADEVQRIHKLEQRPIVVRNIPNYWNINPLKCKEKRAELLATIEKPTNFVLMYHGLVMSGRGIDTLFEIVKRNKNVCAVILGNDESGYAKVLHELSRQLGITERVGFHPAVPIDKLWQYVGAADIGMILTAATVKNHLYSLPNKFFENIQSETPIICPEYPAMKPIVEKYNIGLTCDPTNLDEINACVEKMRTDKEFYTQCKKNLKIAKQDLCWENEKEVLREAYSSIL